MTVKLTECNPVDFLQESEIAEYLAEAFKDEEPTVFIVALGHVVKKKGISNIAKEMGVSRTNLYKTLNGEVKPRWETVHKLLNTLGVTLQVA